MECEQASCGGWAYTCMYHVSLQCLRVGERWELLCVLLGEDTLLYEGVLG